jgi:hypothetical protein
MRRIALLILVAGFSFAPIAARAQDHVEVGAFAEYFKLGETHTNFVGLGGRAAVNLAKYVQIEAEMSYDFNRAFTEGFSSTSGGAVTTQNSNIKVLHGLFGPKIQTPGPVKLFATVKGGFTDFRFDPVPASFSGFTSTVNGLRSNNVDAALYPGVGVEAFLGPIGLRAEVGDEIVFVGGAHHNWKITFGPQLRF